MLMWAAAGFLTGVVLGVPVPVVLALPLAVCLAGAAYRVRSRRWWSLLLCLSFLVLGSMRASHAVTAMGNVGRLNGHVVQLTGSVAEEPDIRDTGANYVIAITGMTVAGATRPVTGRVQVHTTRAETLDYGDRVTLSGRLSAPRNDSLVPYRTVLARRGIASVMRFPRILDLGPGGAGLAAFIVRLRQALEAGINTWLPEPEAALLIAITLGARSASLGTVAQSLVATGLIHIIAISGIKVAMVAGTGYALLRRLPSRPVTLLSALLLLAVYVFLTGDTVSGERSAVMWAMVFLAAYLGRGTLAWQSLAMVAGVMVALQPALVWDPAFQMTALGTASIVAFSDRLMQIFGRLPSPFREAFCVTLAAQAGTIPVVAISFHVISAWGPLANALVLPLLPLLIVLGFALGAVSALPEVAAVVSAFAYVLLHILLSAASALAELPGAFPVGTISAPAIAAYYLAGAALSVWTLKKVHWTPVSRRPATGKDLAFGLGLGAAVLTGTLIPASGPRARLQWLGTGEALLLQSGGRVILVDGSPYPFQLLEALGNDLGMRRHIDAVIVTDPRTNVAGLIDVLSHYSVGEVLDVGCEYPSLTYARWRAVLRDRHIPVYALRTGTSLTSGTATITAIGPDAVYPKPQDSIGLLRVSVSGRTALIVGAASRRELTEAVFRPVKLQADVLVADSGPTTPSDFLRYTRPIRSFVLPVKSRSLGPRSDILVSR